MGVNLRLRSYCLFGAVPALRERILVLFPFLSSAAPDVASWLSDDEVLKPLFSFSVRSSRVRVFPFGFTSPGPTFPLLGCLTPKMCPPCWRRGVIFLPWLSFSPSLWTLLFISNRVDPLAFRYCVLICPRPLALGTKAGAACR